MRFRDESLHDKLRHCPRCKKGLEKVAGIECGTQMGMEYQTIYRCGTGAACTYNRSSFFQDPKWLCSFEVKAPRRDSMRLFTAHPITAGALWDWWHDAVSKPWSVGALEGDLLPGRIRESGSAVFAVTAGWSSATHFLVVSDLLEELDLIARQLRGDVKLPLAMGHKVRSVAPIEDLELGYWVGDYRDPPTKDWMFSAVV